jgi:hypothetical protein
MPQSPLRVDGEPAFREQTTGETTTARAAAEVLARRQRTKRHGHYRDQVQMLLDQASMNNDGLAVLPLQRCVDALHSLAEVPTGDE